MYDDDDDDNDDDSSSFNLSCLVNLVCQIYKKFLNHHNSNFATFKFDC